MAEYITIMVINNKTAGKPAFQLERGATEPDHSSSTNNERT